VAPGGARKHHRRLHVVAPYFGDAGADADRRFSHVVTADRDLALDAGRSLLSRIPENAPPRR
jgi:hypothetical protein